jgi:hypothetical protein
MATMKKYVSGPSEFRAAFAARDMDSKELAAQRQFIEKLELAVVAANREVIHKTIPNLSQATFQSLAVMVARHRAHYLEAAVKLAGAPGQHDPAAFADLKQKREFFEESRAAFDALERAIERGYVEIGK